MPRRQFMPRQPLLYMLAIFLVLHILLVLTTWHCPDSIPHSNTSSRSSPSLLSWLWGADTCQQPPENEQQSHPLVHDSFLSRGDSQQPRPYAYVFCLTSLHNLCTALINVIRLRKLQAFEAADIVAMIPTAWGVQAQAAAIVGSMEHMRTWAVDTVQVPITPYPSASAAAKQHVPIHLFQGVSTADYDIAGMLAKMIALGVKLRPVNVFQHGTEEYNKTSYRKEARSKLLTFDMTEYRQVLYLDADGLIMRNMDEVFEDGLQPVAVLSSSSCMTATLRTATRVLLVRPSKQLHAMLQFVLEKDASYDDMRLLNDFFDADELLRLPASFATQSCDFRKPNAQGKKTFASELLQLAHYVHFADSPNFPAHYEWEDMSRIIANVPDCPSSCASRAAWLYLYSTLTADRESHCLL